MSLFIKFLTGFSFCWTSGVRLSLDSMSRGWSENRTARKIMDKLGTGPGAVVDRTLSGLAHWVILKTFDIMISYWDLDFFSWSRLIYFGIFNRCPILLLCL